MFVVLKVSCGGIIAELVLERAGPAIFTGINHCQTNSRNLSCKRRKA